MFAPWAFLKMAGKFRTLVSPVPYLLTIFALLPIKGILVEFRAILAFVVVDHFGNPGNLAFLVRLVAAPCHDVRDLAVAYCCSLKQEKQAQAKCLSM